MLQNPLPTCGKEISDATITAIKADSEINETAYDWACSTVEDHVDHAGDSMGDFTLTLSGFIGDLAWDADMEVVSYTKPSTWAPGAPTYNNHLDDVVVRIKFTDGAEIVF